MTGRQLRQRTLRTATGRSVHIRVLRPDFTIENVRVLRATYDLWRSQAVAVASIDPKAAFHANFASEVAWLVATHLREWDDASDPHHYLIVVGVDDEGTVLGINTAYFVPEEGVWYMAVGTTRPLDQPGYPNPDQVRGIGLELVGALVGLMNEILCAPVTLEPLDEAAHRFWLSRGFHDIPGSDEMAMSCPESQELGRRLAAAPPDCPDQGDCTSTAGKKLRAAAR